MCLVQIDVGTVEGMTEYKRIIDRNAEFGVTHIVYEPFNSLRSSRKTATDGWGWEGSLWLSMGEQIRNGSWAPKKDKMPPEIQSMLDYAASRSVKLMGYVYPCLNFVGGSGVPAALKGGSMDLSNLDFQKWMTGTMLDFLAVTDGGGFSWGMEPCLFCDHYVLPPLTMAMLLPLLQYYNRPQHFCRCAKSPLE